jgi:hypothetical protein
MVECLRTGELTEVAEVVEAEAEVEMPAIPATSTGGTPTAAGEVVATAAT